ncbi:MAG: lysophospholipase [Clostridia bacterium]|nr:lysophospholipase [Clostridia bacterium]
MEKGFFKSSDGINDIAWYIFPCENPKGIVQISHGMQEYLLRYEDLANYLNQNGYVVCGNDHLGHGASAKEGDLGFMGEKDGYNHVVQDLYKMTELIKERYPDLPIYLHGHSMGSFFGRYYAALYPNELKGLIIEGTGGPNPLGGIGITLTKLLIKLKGAKKPSPFIENLAFGAYTKRIEDAKTGKEWVTRDPVLFEKYVNDPWCNYSFTLAGYKDLMSVLQTVNDKSWAPKIRKDMPVYVVSGKEDPVGEYGKGVEAVYQMLVDAGVKDVTLKLYEDARHEVHNELIEVRKKFYQDLLGWIEKH